MLAVTVAALALQVLLLHHLAGRLVLELVVLGGRLVSGDVCRYFKWDRAALQMPVD